MKQSDLIQKSKLHKLFSPFYSGIGHILTFHRVCTENNYVLMKALQVTPEYLESVIKFFISNNIEIVNLDECYRRINSKDKVKRFVVFTFDDGYVDNYTNALPVFEKYNAPFTIFLTTGFPDHKIVLWWYLLENLINSNNKIEFKDDGDSFLYNTSTLEEKRIAFMKIRNYILESNHKNYYTRLNTIFKDENIDLFRLTRELALSWKQVIELDTHELVTIGAHTVNHMALSRLNDDEVVEEISNSKKIIETKIKSPVQYLAYPIGTSMEAGEREFNLARMCNIKMAVTTEKGNIFKHHTNYLYSLPRIGINENLSIPNIDLYINGMTTFRDRVIEKFTSCKEKLFQMI